MHQTKQYTKFDAGTFFYCPNKPILEGQSPQVQIVAIWIADYGLKKAFPSIATLAKKTGCSKNTVLRSIKKLIDLGILMKEQRYDVKTKQYHSNHYTTLILGETSPSASSEQPSARNELGVVPERGNNSPIMNSPTELHASASADGNNGYKIKKDYILKLSYDFMKKQGIHIVNNYVFQKQIMGMWDAMGDTNTLKVLLYLRDCYDGDEKQQFRPDIGDYIDIARKSTKLLMFAEKTAMQFDESDYKEFEKNGFKEIRKGKNGKQ